MSLATVSPCIDILTAARKKHENGEEIPSFDGIMDQLTLYLRDVPTTVVPVTPATVEVVMHAQEYKDYERRIRDLEREVRRLNARVAELQGIRGTGGAGKSERSGERGPSLISDPDTGKYRPSDGARDRKKYVGLAAASESDSAEPALEDEAELDFERTSGRWTRAPGFVGFAQVAGLSQVAPQLDDSTDSVPELVSSTDTSFDQGEPPRLRAGNGSRK